MADGRLLIGSRRYSSWSMRGWLAVRLADLDVEIVALRMEGGNSPEVLAASPSGLVPFLEHDGLQVWESLAICEYCAEIEPALWPDTRPARTRARSLAAEMHAGFRELRMAMPMNLGRPDYAGRGRTPGALADIARIETLWAETRQAFGAGGPFLFGATFNACDAMFAPVVARLLTYRPDLTDATLAYCEAVRAHPLVAEWYDASTREPEAWRIAKYETVQP